MTSAHENMVTGGQYVRADFSMHPMRPFTESIWICTDFPVFPFASVLASLVWSSTIYNRCFWLMRCYDMEATLLCNSAHTYYHFIFPQNQLSHSLVGVLKNLEPPGPPEPPEGQWKEEEQWGWGASDFYWNVGLCSRQAGGKKAQIRW